MTASYKIDSNLGNYIAGEFCRGTSEELLNVYDPAKGSPTCSFNAASPEDVDRAVAEAKRSFEKWSAVPPIKRGRIMMKFLELLEKNADSLAELVSSEHGKTLEDAKGSIGRGMEVVEFCTGAASHLKSDFTAEVASGVDSHNLRQPLGVCAGITPFNFPAMVPLWMFPVALACGNTFVLKPSEKDPSCPLRMAEIAAEAGVPKGVLNVVVGGRKSAERLLEHPDVAAISFVGSTAVGEAVYRTGSANGKRVQALCGAKNHLVVMPDADMDLTCDALMGAAYGSAGERCMAISVAVAVGEKTADELIAKLTPRVRGLKIGPGTRPGMEMGPIVTRESLERIESYVGKGAGEGAKLVVDGRNPNVEGGENGFFIGGCLFDEVKPNMSIYTDEIFGPVLCVVRAENYDEALKLVNRHEYGNGAAIFTRDGDTARHFQMNALIGMIGVNVPIPVPVAFHSFGGWKRSIFGTNGVHGMEGVRFYTRLKTITTRWPSGIRQGAQFNFKAGSEN